MKTSKVGSLILPLDSDHLHSCGLTRLQNKVTGTKIFYHRLIIEERKRKYSTHFNPSQSMPQSTLASEGIKETPTSNQTTNDHHHHSNDDSIGHPTSSHESFDHIEGGSHKLRDQGDNDEYTDITQEILVVKCVIPGQQQSTTRHLVKRQSNGQSFPIWDLPDNFTESSE